MIKSIYSIFNKNWIVGNGTIWVYSDTHFGDLDCYMQRFPQLFSSIPYEEDCLLDTVKALDTMQIDNINSKCGKNDTLIILGDVGNADCIKRLKARYKILIKGNHDKGASNYKRNFARVLTNIWDEGKEYTLVNEIPSYDDDNHLFDEVYTGGLQIGEKLYISHEPVRIKGCLNIHGHLHKDIKDWYEFVTDGTGELWEYYHYNVIGESNQYFPVSLNEIIKSGILNEIKDIHRICIDKAVQDKKEKMKNEEN